MTLESELGILLGEVAIDSTSNAAELELAETVGLGEQLLNALTTTLADGVASMAQRASVDGGFAPLAGLAQMAINRDMRSDFALAQSFDEAGTSNILSAPSVIRDVPYR